MHAAALKHGLTLGADVTFMDIPVCGGHQDDGTKIGDSKLASVATTSFGALVWKYSSVCVRGLKQF